MTENEEIQENQELEEAEARQKILVADDEASIRRILETRLKMEVICLCLMTGIEAA